MRIIATAACLIALSGCAEYHHRQDLASCEGYGWQQGTKEYAACMERADLARAQRRSNSGVATSLIGLQMMNRGY